MPITQDKAWCAETIPPNLSKLIDQLCEFYKVPRGHVGCKGDPSHRRGYHRSRRFLISSAYAKNRSYSVKEKGNDGGHPDWLSALDISLDAKRLIPMCRRLDKAVRAGQLEKVAEWYGNLGNDNRVDGYDNVRNAVASSDPSHMWHAHISFVRSHANDDHTDLFRILTGQAGTSGKMASAPAQSDSQESDMDPSTSVPVPSNKPYPGYLGSRTALPAGELWHAIYYRVTDSDRKISDLAKQVATLAATVDKLSKK